MIKKMSIALFVLFLAISFASAIETNLTEVSLELVPSSPNIQALSLKYEPYPVEPGEYFSLWVKVQNVGTDEAPGVICVIEPQYPFYLDPETPSVQTYGKLGSFKQAVLEFKKIRIDENAVEGDNELEVKCSANGGASWVVNKFIISIQTRYATLNIKEVKTIPKPIAPGSRAQLLITLENLADSSMKDVNIALNLSDSPMAPFNGVPEKKVRRINAGNFSDLFFDIVVLPNTDGGIYKIPLTLNYTDELGKEYSTNSMISVEVGAVPDIYVVIDSTTIYSRKRVGDVTIKIVNKGLTDLKFLDVTLQEGIGYKIISSPQVYVGDLDSDSYETVDFRIEVNEKNITLPLKLDYKDTSNNQHLEDVNVTFNLVSAQELGQKESYAGIIFLTLAIAVLIFMIYRSWKKRHMGKTFSDFLLVIPRAFAKRKK